MAVIRERSPSEINIEKKLLNFEEDSTEDSESPNSLYGFFRKKTKSMVDYHFDKMRKKKGAKKENIPEKKPKFKPEEEKDIKNTTLKRKKGKLVKKTGDEEEIPEENEFLRVKEMLKKRRFVIESAIVQLQSQMKPLSTIKVTTNREHLVQQVCDIENVNEKIISDLESQLLSLHDCMRQVEKLGHITSHETKELKTEISLSHENEMKKEREKYERQIEALKELNNKLSNLPRATDVEYEYKKKLKELDQQFEQKNIALEEKTENLIKKSTEVGSLQVNLHRKQQEIDKLNNEIENMQRILESRQSDFDEQLKNNGEGFQNLNERYKSLSKELEQSKISANERLLALEQSKDKEILRLQKELTKADQDFRERLNNFKLDDEEKNREFRELRDEIQRLQSQKENLLQNGDQEVFMLRKALEDKDKQMAQERERMLIEIENKEKYRIKQKNEWAEIYTGLKHEIKDLKERLLMASQENENLAVRMDRSQGESLEGQMSLKTQIDAFKQKIREKEQELKNLWEVLAELQKTHQTKGKIDFNDVRTLIVIKNLEEKARQRIRL